MAACKRLDLSLNVLGNGPDHKKLRKLAGPKTTFVSNVPDAVIAQHLASAEALIFPGLDDFGITPVEALASGTPVVAYRGGGALDYINDETGLFFDTQTLEALMKVLEKFDPKSFSDEQIKKAASKFSRQNFQENIEEQILKIRRT